MGDTVIAALIGAGSAILLNVLTNVILTNRQTALLEYRIGELERMLRAYGDMLPRVISLETWKESVDAALHEMRTA